MNKITITVALILGLMGVGCVSSGRGEPAETFDLSGRYDGRSTATYSSDGSTIVTEDVFIPVIHDGDRVYVDMMPGSSPACIMELDFEPDCELGYACAFQRTNKTCVYSDLTVSLDGTTVVFDGAGRLVADTTMRVTLTAGGADTITAHFDGRRNF